MKKLMLLCLILFVILIAGCTNTIHSESLLNKNCSVDSDCKIVTNGECGGSAVGSYDCVNINENNYCSKGMFIYTPRPMDCICDSKNNSCKAPETDEEFNKSYNKLIDKCEANDSKKLCYHDIVSIPAYAELNRTIDFCKNLKYSYECFSGIFDSFSTYSIVNEMPQTKTCADRCPDEWGTNAKYWCFITSLTNNSICDNTEPEHRDFCFYGVAMFEVNSDYCDKINSSIVCNNCHVIPIMLRDDCYYSLSEIFILGSNKNATKAKMMCGKISAENVRNNCYEIEKFNEEYKLNYTMPCPTIERISSK